MNKVVIYGAGRTGKSVWEKCVRIGIEAVCFVDCNIKGTFCGIPVVSPENVPADVKRDLPVILALHHDVHGAAELMKSAGFTDLQTLSAFNIMLRRDHGTELPLVPLFDPLLFENCGPEISAAEALFTDERSRRILRHYMDYLKYGRLDDLEKREPGIMYFPDNRPFEFCGKVTMADCGAYIGDTIMSLIGRIDFDKIYAFDPDPLVVSRLQENLKKYNGIDFHFIQSGVGSCRSELAFTVDGTGRGMITEDGDNKIQIVTLDEIFEKQKVDFIKMDIEGAEADALLGAAGVIKRDMPLLEISVYHRPGDFWKLPHLIKELNPEYSLFLRCGEDSFHDTVVVAVPERFRLKQ